jgi:predicted acyl esterase
VVRAKVTLFPTANLFLPDHRIRLDVSSSDFPKFDVNPKTGEPEGASRGGGSRPTRCSSTPPPRPLGPVRPADLIAKATHHATA